MNTTMVSPVRVWLGLVGWILVCFATAALGSLATTPEIGAWYAELQKPSWTPPNWIFGPVWTFLYLCMAVSAWLVWRRDGFGNARGALTAFCCQLLLNAGWSWCFFGLHRPGLAFVEILFLWAAILTTLLLFWRTNRLAAMLLLPYLLWVSFAAILNFCIFALG
jgi:tryptophan-rich sensory protein